MSLSRDERQFVSLRSQTGLEPFHQGWRNSVADTLVGWTGQVRGNGIASGTGDCGHCGPGCAHGCLRGNRAVGVAVGNNAADSCGGYQHSSARDPDSSSGCCRASARDPDANSRHADPAGIAFSSPDRCTDCSNPFAAASNSDPARSA